MSFGAFLGRKLPLKIASFFGEKQAYARLLKLLFFLGARISHLEAIEMMGFYGSVSAIRGSWILIQHNVARAKANLHAKFHLDPSNHLATIHQCDRQTGQRSDSIGRTVLQMVAQKMLTHSVGLCLILLNQLEFCIKFHLNLFRLDISFELSKGKDAKSCFVSQYSYKQ